MALVNEHFLKLPGSYLFSDIAKKINTFRDNASQAGHHPARYRRCYSATSQGLYRSNAQSSRRTSR